MPYQVLILTKDWFLSEVQPGKFRVLLQIINKGYSKPMAQYGNIQSPRIKDHERFLDSLQLELDSGNSKKGKTFAIMLLLGSRSDFHTLETKSRYTRKFNPDIWPLSGSKDSDIPSEFSSAFGPLIGENIEHVVFSASDQIDNDIADRVLATIGLKTYLNDGFFTSEDTLSQTKHFEITALTSFMRGMGKGIIEYIEEFIHHEGARVFNIADANQLVLHAVVIKEHELVPFYEKVCNFRASAHPDVLVEVTGSDSPLEDGINAKDDFSISFLRKEILINK